jgi:hypothetical protein
VEAVSRHHEGAIQFMNEALGIYRSWGDWTKVALVLINLAVQEIELGRPEMALERLDEIELAKVQDAGLQTRVQSTRAFALVRMRDMSEARQKLADALTLWSKAPDVTVLSGIFLCISSASAEILSPVERAQFLGAADALAESSFASYSEPQSEIRDEVRDELVAAIGSREVDRYRKQGARLDSSILVQRALHCLRD